MRTASVTEDPANRRLHGSGGVVQALYLLPMFRAEVVATASGPAVVHSADFSLVTAAKPARSGEILSLFASGLGPTIPGVEPGEPFTSETRHVVNSPVEVLVNGRSGEVLYAVIVTTQFRLSQQAVDGYLIVALGPTSLARINEALEKRLG